MIYSDLSLSMTCGPVLKSHDLLSYDTNELSMMMIRQLSRIQCGRVVSRNSPRSRYVHTPAKLNWEDPLNTASLFTPEELSIQESAQGYCQDRLLPRVLGTQAQQLWGEMSIYVVDHFPL